MSRPAPPGRRTGPRRGPSESQPLPGALDLLDTVPPDGDNGTHLAPVVRLHGLDRHNRERLQLALDGVPCALGMAAGQASVLLPYDVGPGRARLRLEQLRLEWHALVDSSIGMALDDLGRVS